MMKALGIDLVIPLILIVAVVVIIVLLKMGALPKKTLPFIIAGVASVFGIAMFQSWRNKSMRKELEERERKLRELEKRARANAAGVAAADSKRMQAIAELQRQKEAAQKELLLIDASTTAEREQISQLHGEDLFARFIKTFPN